MSNKQLSAYFTQAEFACACGCGYAEVDPALIEGLEQLRHAVGGKPITITSGCRCAKHNKAVGGVAGSQHTRGKAADIRVKGVSPAAVGRAAAKVSAFANGGIGQYKTFVHIDTGPKRRWNG